MGARFRVTPSQKQRHARYMRFYMQNRADHLRDAGLCVICGKRAAREEKQTCQPCIGRQCRRRAA